MMNMIQEERTGMGEVYNTNWLTCYPHCNISINSDTAKISWGAKQTKIVDIKTIVPNKVVECTFADEGKEKSVCTEPDTFSMERAISICISKHVMGGSSKYNNAIKSGLKVYEEQLKKDANAKAELERIAKKRAKRLAYKERRAKKLIETEEKSRLAKKEEMIEIQKEAYIRAMEIMGK